MDTMMTSTLDFSLLFIGVSSVILIGCHFLMTHIYRTRSYNLSFVILISIFHAFTFLQLKDKEEDIRQVFADRLSGYSPAYGAAIKSLGIDKINPETSDQDPTYLKIIDAQVQWQKENKYVSDIYVFGKNKNNEVVLLVDSESDYDQDGLYKDEKEQRTPIGHIYEEVDQHLHEAFQGIASFDLSPVSDDWGTWISSYYPIQNEAGSWSYVVGVDFAYHKFAEDIQKGLFQTGLIQFAYLLIILGAFVAYRLREKAFEKQLTLKKDLELYQARNLANAKFAALGEMAAGVAHEINNPLMVIVGRASLIKRYFKEQSLEMPANLVEHINSIESTAHRISQIVKGLRTFSRDGEKDSFQNCLLAGIIDDTLALCQERLRFKKIDFKTWEVPNVEIVCRSSQITQVLINLISNSIDAIDELEDKWIHISYEKRSGKLLIRVTDSGHGIKPEVVDKIMDPFYTTKEVGKGTGLGLSISKGIMESHRGELRYELHEDHTSFVLEIPIAVEHSTIIETIR